MKTGYIILGILLIIFLSGLVGYQLKTCSEDKQVIYIHSPSDPVLKKQIIDARDSLQKTFARVDTLVKRTKIDKSNYDKSKESINKKNAQSRFELCDELVTVLNNRIDTLGCVIDDCKRVIDLGKVYSDSLECSNEGLKEENVWLKKELASCPVKKSWLKRTGDNLLKWTGRVSLVVVGYVIVKEKVLDQ